MRRIPGKHISWLTGLLWLCVMPTAGQAQARPAQAPETRRYSIEVAGVRVGTMTATRQPQSATDVLYSLVSDVQVNFLLYHLKIYYQVHNQFHKGQLMLSTVEAHTNQGDFASRTEWKGNHYDILADQYKHHYQATETRPITYTVTNLFFGEPLGNSSAFAEYFGDYFAVSPAPDRTYRARRDGREDEYQYAQGQLVTITKKNPLKNFVIKLLP